MKQQYRVELWRKGSRVSWEDIYAFSPQTAARWGREHWAAYTKGYKGYTIKAFVRTEGSK